MLSLKIAKLVTWIFICLSYSLLAISTQTTFSKCDQVGFNLSNKDDRSSFIQLIVIMI